MLFLKCLLLAQGVVWSIATLCIVIFDLHFGPTEIMFSWIIAVLFSLVIWKIDSNH